MRSTEERVDAVMSRVRELKMEEAAGPKKVDLWRNRLLVGGAFAACLAILIGIASYFPNLAGVAGQTQDMGEGSASILAEGPGGYIVIGVLAFICGAALTLLCVRLRDRGRI